MKVINAHHNNLKNIQLTLPEHQLIVVTGLSGSGKSSLAMEVIANEGYRHYLESLPDFHFQNNTFIPSAEVDEIQDLPPVIKVEQSKRFQSIQATFGTLSDLTPVFRILFARFSSSKTLSKSLFSFNHPKGACSNCKGIGEEEYIDLNKLVSAPDKSLRDGAIATTLPNGYITYSQVTVEELNKVCNAHGFSVDIPWNNLSKEQQEVILHGSNRIKVFYGKHSIESRLKWKDLKAKPREEGYYKGMFPIMYDILKRDRNNNILKFVSARECPECKGARINKESLKYQWHQLNFLEWMRLPLSELYAKLKSERFTKGEETLIGPLLHQLNDLIQLGMGAYSLSTPSFEISTGDAQRIKLVNQVNTKLQGILYVFDEPSVGLIPHYQTYLLHIFRRLIKQGNTVMVVEHDLDFIQSADWIVELGPASGSQGGGVLFNGTKQDFLKLENIVSPTLQAIASEKSLQYDTAVCDEKSWGFQKGQLVTIQRNTAFIKNKLTEICHKHSFQEVYVSDQPIGKTPRSNPATYVGLADRVRDLFSKTETARSLKLEKGRFSFNNKAGRCDACEGGGWVSLSMSLMGNVNQICPTCDGKRFKKEVLQAKWNGKSIAEVYALSIEEALVFFSGESKIVEVLELLQTLGLGYLKLGQPSNTLSGGEAQRIKLAKHFSKRNLDTLLIIEEPSIGLHYQNVKQLIQALNTLKQRTTGIVCFENHSVFRSNSDKLVKNEDDLVPQELNELAELNKNKITVKGARTHHLKNVDIDFPKNKLTVVSGISGSGKSSLVIDTLYGYGKQSMHQQFSTYHQSRASSTNAFEVDSIEGLTPTICITRKHTQYKASTNLAKQTGIYKKLRFAFSRKAQFQNLGWSASHFSNNHELGKCEHCDGIGEVLLPDLQKVIEDDQKSVNTGLLDHNKALAYYGDKGSQFMAILQEVGKKHGFTLKTPFSKLTASQKDLLLYGTGDKVWSTEWRFKTKTREGKQLVNMTWEGIINYIQQEYKKTKHNKNINNLLALFSSSSCEECLGSGLKKDRLRITIAGRSIQEVLEMNFNDLNKWLKVSKNLEEVDHGILETLKSSLISTIQRAKELHIDHLSLSRKSTSLSGGENQRVDLIQQLNSPLKGITYLLDEPSAGLSHENIPDLLNIFKELVSKGNTVVVIEHEKEIIKAADHLIQMGVGAGKLGGEVVFDGVPEKYFALATAHPYLKSNVKEISFEKGSKFITILNADKYTLKKEKLLIPIGGVTALKGKSGVGKTTLVKEIILPSILHKKAINCSSIESDLNFKNARYFDKKRLKSHSNTMFVEYWDLMKEIGKVFAKATGKKSAYFSFKNKSIQCKECGGKGSTAISLDIAGQHVEICEQCKGSRYDADVLLHKVNERNISEVLSMEVDGAKAWLSSSSTNGKVLALLQSFQEIGLGHISLDQPIHSLSSGEKQRMLLLNWLQDVPKEELLILDEPSTGLAYEDIDWLYPVLEKLGQNNSVLVIEHNPYLLSKIGVGLSL